MNSQEIGFSEVHGKLGTNVESQDSYRYSSCSSSPATQDSGYRCARLPIASDMINENGDGLQ